MKKSLSDFIKESFHIINPGCNYYHNWHIDLIAHALDLATSGKIKRLIINMPPRSLKSLCVAVAWPAWILGNTPSKRIISASYAQKLSDKHALDCKKIINSEWFSNLYPDCIISKQQNARYKYMTTNQGFRFSTSVGGTLTGEGGDILIIDDPAMPDQMQSEVGRMNVINWFEGTFLSRLDNKKDGVIVIVMQRLHEQDLTGHIMSKSSNWHYLSLPIQFADNIEIDFFGYKRNIKKGEILNQNIDSVDLIDELRKQIGGKNFAAQYLQNPLAFDGHIIKPIWINYYVNPPVFNRIILSWDTALKTEENNDFTVCTIWGIDNNKYYLIDLFREKLEFPDLKKEFIRLSNKYKPSCILIEDKASGTSLIQEMHYKSHMPIIAVKAHKSKTLRLSTASAAFEAGLIYLDKNASWLSDYIQEITKFPATSNDDMVDSTSQFINYMTSNINFDRIIKGL